MSIVSMVVYLDYAPGILSCCIEKLALFTSVKKLDLSADDLNGTFVIPCI